MLKRYAAYCVLVLLLCTSFCYSQDFIYKNYDVQDGLPNPTVHGIFQDRDGFLWIGTGTGLCRYDGNKFKTFTVKDGLPANRVDKLFQDSKGRIWLLQSSDRIAYILNGKVFNRQNDTLLEKIKLNSVPRISEDAAGNLVILNNYKLYILSYEENTVRTISDLDGSIVMFQTIYADKNGNISLIVAHEPYLPLKYKDQEKTNSKEYYWHKKASVFDLRAGRLKFNRTIYSYDTTKLEASAISHLHKNFLVFGLFGDRCIIFLRDTIIRVKPPMSNTYMISIVSDSVISFNTKDGAFLFNIHTRLFTNLLPGVVVNAVFLDKEKNLWIGTVNEGVYKISSQAIKNKSLSPYRDDIHYLKKEGENIIAGNSIKEVFEIDENWQTTKISPVSLTEYSTKILLHEKLDHNKYVMVHEHGITFYKNGKVIEEMAGNNHKLVPVDKDKILLGAHFGAVVLNRQTYDVIDMIWERKTRSLYMTNDTIIAGGLVGLFILKKVNGEFKIIDSLLPGVTTRFIQRSADNLVWLCSSEHGLFCMKNGKVWKNFTDTSGLPSNNGTSLFIHGNDVWMGTDKGLVKITRHNDNFRFQKFSTSDGLVSNMINTIYVDSSSVYLGTPKGICFFNEKMIDTNSICNLKLTGVIIGDSSVALADKYLLRANQRISIEYSGISLRSEQEMSYRYKIHGLDENWRSSKLNILEFTALPHGKYDLEIIAINKFGKESGPLKIRLEVTRPFHKTTWFILSMIMLPVLIFILLVNSRINRGKTKQLQKLQQEIKITKLEQMALRAQMNPHFIFNCISAIQQLITEKDTGNASRFISSFADLVRQTLDNAPELFISLPEEIKFLDNYFELERIRLEDLFSYNIRTEGLTAKEQIRVPNMVIQPFVENAIKHGIRYKKNGRGFIEVLFQQQENALRCTITDNGVGREKAMQMKKESGVNHMSKGMGITMKRIESLNALTNQDIHIDIEDLVDEHQQASGTKVTINFYNINDSYDKDTHY